MSSRARLVLIVVAPLSLPTAVFAAFAARSDDSNGPAAIVEEVDSSGPTPRSRRSKGRSGRRPRRQTSRFATRTATSSASALRGKVVVLSPMYSTCEDTCPLTAQQIRGALDDLSGTSERGFGRSR